MNRKSVRTALFVIALAVPLFPIALGLLGGDAKPEAQAIQWTTPANAAVATAAQR